MGRIKTKLVKRLTVDMIKEYPGKFKETFDENKVLVKESLSGTDSKKLRNMIAGYVTRLIKSKREI